MMISGQISELFQTHCRCLVGEEDQLFLPEKFKDVFDAERSEIPVSILPGLGHSEMVTSPQAIRAVVAAFRE